MLEDSKKEALYLLNEALKKATDKEMIRDLKAAIDIIKNNLENM